MVETRGCPQCGAEIPPDAAEGLCPKCLMRLGLDGEETSPVDPDQTAPVSPRFCAPQPEELSKRFPQLEILELLGQGGMGAVYKARQPALDRVVAVKILPPQVAENPGFTERFLEEAQVTAQLDHPGIVPVHELGFDTEERVYFTMKTVKGCELGEVFALAREERDGWNLPRAVGVMVKVCQALAYAHAKGVIHRDLKPANIMVGRFGEVYVMDWGLAKVLDKEDLHDIRLKATSDITFTTVLHSDSPEPSGVNGDSPLITMDGSIVGTPAYMSPEQAKGRIAEVDASSDVYSLGAILYSLLTGQAPYVAPGDRISPHTILAAVTQGPPKPVHELNHQAPPELVAICEKATARAKKDRYRSSLELAEDLQAFLDNRVVKAYRTGAMAELRSWVRRNRAAAVVGVACGALLLVVAGFYAVNERGKALRLREDLAREYLRRGQMLCEEGRVARGLHWFARSLNEAPEESGPLEEIIQENLAGWGAEWAVPLAVLPYEGVVITAALSPDGKRVLTGTEGGARLWFAEAAEPELLAHDGFVLSAAFSPDGSRVVTGSGDRTAKIWDTESLRLIHTLSHAAGVQQATFTADGTRVLTGSFDGTARLWNVETGELVGTPFEHGAEVVALAISLDGTQILSGGLDGTARLWNVDSGKPVGAPLVHRGAVRLVTFSPDGMRVLTASSDGTARVWDAATGEPVGEPLLHADEISAAAFSPDGSHVLTGSLDQTARLWDTETGKPIGTVLVHRDKVRAIVYSADGESVFTGGDDKTARLWSLETGKRVGPPRYHPGGINRMVLSSDGRRLLVNGGHTSSLWAVSAERSDSRVSPVRGGAVAFAPGSERAAIGGETGAFWWWSTRTGELSNSNLRHEVELWSVTFSPDGHLVLTTSVDGTAKLWDKESETLLHTFDHDGQARAGAFSTNGRLIATGSFDGTARVWSAETGKEIASLEHPNLVEDVAFAPDGETLLTGCGDGAARVWSWRTKQVRTILRHRESVLAVAFSPDGRLLATGSRDGTVRFWSSRTGEPNGIVLEHHDWVEDFCFSRDGTRLLTATQGGSIRFWFVETGDLLGPPIAYPTAVLDVDLSWDNSQIIAAGAVGLEPSIPRLFSVSQPFRGDLRFAELWVEVLTWSEMNAAGVVTTLGPVAWRERRDRLETLGGPPVPVQ